MSDTTIVAIVAVEADTLVVDVVVAPPAALAVDVIAPPPAVAVIEVADWGSVPVGYPQLPLELQQLPITFPFSGKPVAGTVINIPMAFSLIVPPNLTGTVSYAATAPTANAAFLLNRLSGGAVSNLGSIVLTASGNDILVGAGGTLAVGEVLQLVPPADQDPSLSDVGITVITERVQ